MVVGILEQKREWYKDHVKAERRNIEVGIKSVKWMSDHHVKDTVNE